LKTTFDNEQNSDRPLTLQTLNYIRWNKDHTTYNLSVKSIKKKYSSLHKVKHNLIMQTQSDVECCTTDQRWSINFIERNNYNSYRMLCKQKS